MSRRLRTTCVFALLSVVVLAGCAKIQARRDAYKSTPPPATTTTTLAPTTTTTTRPLATTSTTAEGFLNDYSADDIPSSAQPNEDPLCARVDEVAVSGMAIGSFGSSTDARPEDLTAEQRAAAYQELLRFRTKATALVDELASQGLLPDGTLQAALADFSRQVDGASPDDDVRQLFNDFFKGGSPLQRTFVNVLVPRCPSGVLSKLSVN